MANNFTSTATTIVDISNRSVGLGGANVGTYSVLHGLNPLGGLANIPQNTDTHGLVFFTKPMLNLSRDNVMNSRKMTFLADTDPLSMGNYIRCLLNPKGFDPEGDKLRSTVNDDNNIFLPISNLLINLSPPPDYVADTYTSDEGINKEQVSFIDSKPNVFSSYDMTGTFANMEGDPISAIFTTWTEYMTRVAEGSMLPFPIHILQRRLDYNTRIYRLILDKSKRFVQKIFACGAAFPYTSPEGAVMGYDVKEHLSKEADEIQIVFKCNGAIYNDPILVYEFNLSVVKYNPDIAPGKRVNHTKVIGTAPNGKDMRLLMAYNVYPYIADTMELEWYAPNDIYKNTLALFNDVVVPNTNATPITPTANTTTPT